MSELLVNLHDYPTGQVPKHIIRIGRPSRWGNPYPVGRFFNREQAVEKYRVWLLQCIEQDPDFLEPLRDQVLGCWCKPLPCHGDAILEWLREHPRG